MKTGAKISSRLGTLLPCFIALCWQRTRGNVLSGFKSGGRKSAPPSAQMQRMLIISADKAPEDFVGIINMLCSLLAFECQLITFCC